MTLWRALPVSLRLPASPLAVFAVLCVGMVAFVLYASFEYAQDELLVYQRGETIGAIAMLVVLPVLVVATWLLLRLPSVRFRAVPFGLIALGTIILALPLLVIPPVTSGDAYYSLYYGQVTALGENPYTTTIRQHFLAPFAATIHPIFYNLPTPYGPAWSGLMGFVARLTGFNPATGLLGLRILSLVAVLLVMFILTRAMTGDAAKKTAAVIGWHPLILLYLINEAHNDALVLLSFAATVYLVRRRLHLGAGVALIAGGLIKWVPLLLLPLVVADAFARRSRRSALQLAIILAVVAAGAVIIGFLPYWDGWGFMQGIRGQTQLLNTSPFVGQESFLLRLWDGRLSEVASGVGIVKAVGIAVFLGLAGWLLLRVGRQKIAFSEAAFLTLALFVLFGLSWFMPWYVLWLLPFAVCHPPYLKLVMGLTLILLWTFLLPLTLGMPLLIAVLLVAYAITKLHRALTNNVSALSHGRSR